MRRAATAVTLALVCGLLLTPPLFAQSRGSTPCRLHDAFAGLVSAVAMDLGSCQSEPVAAPNGDLSQRTSKGLLVRRQSDNWTAFITGSWTWVDGPEGVAKRPNPERFDWEAGGGPDDGAMFSDVSGALLSGGDLAGGYSANSAHSSLGPFMSSMQLEREGTNVSRLGPFLIQESVWLLPTTELAHATFTDQVSIEHGDLSLTTTLADEAQVTGWRSDTTTGYNGRFAQISVHARRSNAVVNVVLAPAPRLEMATQIASMIIARLV
jgi:hypothetical protein